MKLCLGLLLIITFLGCQVNSWEYMSDFDQTLNSIARRTGIQIEKEFKFMRFAGVGGGLSKGYIEEESLVFEVQKELNRDEGVVIISKIINEYLQNMYSEKKMHAYLREYPFTYKNLEIVFFIDKENGEDVYHPGIGFLSLDQGNVVYRTVSETDTIYYKFESCVEESYEEAAKRVGVWPPGDFVQSPDLKQ